MLASGFSFAGMFSFLSAGPFVYIEINHVSPQDFGYYFALNIVFLFLMTIINGRFVRRMGAQNVPCGLWVQFVMALWMVITALLGVGFWSLVVGVAALSAVFHWCRRTRWRSFLMNFPIWQVPLRRWPVRFVLVLAPLSARCFLCRRSTQHGQ
jgi:hypothetical protein